jgi:hypothetical protein
VSFDHAKVKALRDASVRRNLQSVGIGNSGGEVVGGSVGALWTS